MSIVISAIYDFIVNENLHSATQFGLIIIYVDPRVQSLYWIYTKQALTWCYALQKSSLSIKVVVIRPNHWKALILIKKRGKEDVSSDIIVVLTAEFSI